MTNIILQWYDGQIFVKPPEVLGRDRLLGTYEVRRSASCHSCKINKVISDTSFGKLAVVHAVHGL